MEAASAYETASLHLQAAWDDKWAHSNASSADLTAAYAAHATAVVPRWWELFDDLLFDFADGWVNVPTLGGGVGYPAWWLKQANLPRPGDVLAVSPTHNAEV